MDVVNGKKTKAFKLAIAKSNQDEAESDATKRKTGEEDEEDEDDSGNWKRQRKSEYPVAYEFWRDSFLSGTETELGNFLQLFVYILFTGEAETGFWKI